jgi:glycerate dehydrogenase
VLVVAAKLRDGRTMNIVVLDGYTLDPGDLSWTPLEALGACTVHRRTPPELLLERARGAPILLTNKTRLGRQAIEALPGLRYIGVLATGYDVVDVAAAREHGVTVCNVPDYGAASVAQHTFALLLELTNQVGEHARLVRAGEWTRRGEFSFAATPLVELAGSTFGVVGAGSIGRRVAHIAQALGMRVVAAGRSHAAPAADGLARVELDALFRSSDVVSLHCPLTDATRGMVNAVRLASMKPGALLINTARGGLVDSWALREALDTGQLGGAALDVLDEEPPGEGHPLLDAPRCVLTPHNAWASRAARMRLLATAADNVRAFLAGSPIHVV